MQGQAPNPKQTQQDSIEQNPQENENIEQVNQQNQPQNTNQNQQQNDQDFEDIGSDDYEQEEQGQFYSQQQQHEESSSLQQPSQSQQQNPADKNKNKCPHYERQCHVEAPCCKIFYPCKLCHDQKYEYKKGCQSQRMAFDKVENVKCLKCEQVQPASLNCRNLKCQVKFGEYACLKCMLYENNPKKKNDIFHCDDCKMCRRGTIEGTFHCFKCGYCRPLCDKDNHKCNENVAESQCPICLQILKYSTKYYQSMPCGHLIHTQCLMSLKDINCPVCGMAMQKMSKQHNEHIQKLIDQTKDKLPQQVKNHKVNILCNECLHKTTNAPFHYYGVKCEKCGTFNTKMM